jgi:hypothetical protein
MATPAYRSRAAFVEHGLKKHALTEKDDRKCAICFDPYTAETPADVKEPMTASTEDADHTLVKEPTTDSTEDADHTPAIITGCGHIYGSVYVIRPGLCKTTPRTFTLVGGFADSVLLL